MGWVKFPPLYFMITNFLIAGLLLMPWVFIPMAKMADPFRLPKATFFDLICISIIVLSFFKGVNYRYMNKYLAIFVGWVFTSIFFYWYVPFTNTIHNTQQVNFFIIAPMIHFILGLWTTQIVLSVFEKEDFIKIAKAICLSSMLITAFGITQVLGFNPISSFRYLYTEYMPNFTALLDHPSMVGNYLCLSLPFFILFKGKKYIFGFIFVLIGLILTKSDISLFAFAFSMFLLLLLKIRENKKLLFGIIIIALLLSCLVYVNTDQKIIDKRLEGRLGIWQTGYSHLKDNPLFGQGFGVVRTFNERVDNGKLIANFHNDWLNLGVELGFVGVFLLILIIVNSFRHFNYDNQNILGIVYLLSFVSFLIIMVGSFPLEFAPNALLGLVGWWGVEKL